MLGSKVQVPSLEGFLFFVALPNITMQNTAGQLGLRVATYILRPTAFRFTNPAQRPVRRSSAPHHASLAFAKRRK